MFKNFSPGLLGMRGIWHCHGEAVPLLPVGLDVFCEMHSEDLTEPQSKMHDSDFHRASENEVRVLNEKTVKRLYSAGFDALVK
jgi:hypothetical protein